MVEGGEEDRAEDGYSDGCGELLGCLRGLCRFVPALELQCQIARVGQTVLDVTEHYANTYDKLDRLVRPTRAVGGTTALRARGLAGRALRVLDLVPELVQVQRDHDVHRGWRRALYRGPRRRGPAVLDRPELLAVQLRAPSPPKRVAFPALSG